jgi:hypothetical protein
MRKCRSLCLLLVGLTVFRAHASCEDLLDSLGKLNRVVEGTARTNFPSRLQIKDGQGYLRIGYITRNNPELPIAIFQAVKEGLIAVIQADIYGPKILSIVTRMTRVAPSQHPMTVYGYLYPKDLAATVMRASQKEPGIHSKPLDYLSPQEVKAFYQAADELGIPDACQDIYGSRDLNDCGPLLFELDATKPHDIQWSKTSVRRP